MAFIKVDDTDPRFDYKDNLWGAGGQDGEFNSTSHSTSTGSAIVTFGPFSGTSIAVFSTVGTRQARLHFTLDGSANSDLPAQTESSVQFQQQVYSVGGLDSSSPHSLAINLLDPGPFTLDYVVIGQAKRLVNTSLGSTSTTSVTITSGSPTIIASSTGTTGTVGASSITSSLDSSQSDDSIIPSTPSITSTSTSISTSTSHSDPSSAPPSPATVGTSPSSTVQNTDAPTLSESSTPMSAASSSGPDAVVIGSVTGAIVFLALVVVITVLLMRRRRRRRSTYRGRSAPNSQSQLRPSLHLSIPSSLSLSRALHRPNLLPTHSSKSIPSSLKHAEPLGMPRPTPSFLAEDPNDSPIFDIKQRPASGSTVTTRVTVGTTIGQRFSVPESVYSYPNLGTSGSMPVPPIPIPPMPALLSKSSNPSPTETGASSTTGSASHLVLGLGLGLPGANPVGTFDTSVFSGYSENGTAPKGSGTSASRPLPHIPSDTKRSAQPIADRELDGYESQQSQLQNHPYAPRRMPTTPSDAETFVHEDGGVRLASSVHVQQPRRELPPPYRDYGI